MNTLTLNKVLLNARPLNMRKRVVKDKDFIYKVLDREFTFSKTAGGKSIKSSNARIEVINGNAVVWNQLIRLENFVATNADITNDGQKFTVVPTGVAPGIIDQVTRPIPIVGHKYILLCEKSGGTRAIYINWGGHNASLPTSIFTATDSSELVLTIFSYNETETFTLTTPKLIDLTKAFPNDWQDINTIEDFYRLLPANVDINEYNEGEVIPFTAEGIKSIGDNAWDEEWEEGQISVSNGQNGLVDSTIAIRSKNYIKVLPNQQYAIISPVNTLVLGYDAQLNYTGYLRYGGTSKNFYTQSTTAYIKFCTFSANYGTTYNNDICISLVHSGYKEGQYFPYEQDIRKIDSRILEAFPNGMMPWDKVYNKNGKGYIVKGSGVKKLWEHNGWVRGRSLVFIATIPDMMPSLNINTAIMAEYNLCSTQNGSTMMDNAEDKSYITNGGSVGSAGSLAISDSAYNDVDSFVAHLEEVQAKLYYELAEPTIIEYDEPFNLDYKVWNCGTEQVIANVPSAPLKADIGYHILKNNLELTLNS